MKLFRRTISILALICLMCAMLPMAYAAPVDNSAADAAADTGAADAAANADAAVNEEATPDPAEMFEGKSWDEVIEAFLLKHNVPENQISFGYYNTVTGEEHYFRPDEYIVAASMYKVPLNMVFAERVYNGEMTWQTELYTVPYERLMEETIINSSNNFAEVLWLNLGNYNQFRRTIAPYMGEDPDTVDYKFYENNYFTSRQMIHCLKLLYSEQERFPRIIETMLKAEPTNYFSLYEDRYDVAHKYGFLQENYHLYMNDCGIAYTDDPILLVMFTDNLPNAYEVLGDYCTLMCDYTQYNTAKRLEAERLAEELRQQEAEAAAAATPEPIPIPIPEKDGSSGLGASALIGVGLTALLAALAIGGILICVRKNKMRLLWAALAVITAAAAILLCVVASSAGTIIAKPEGDPQAVVTDFFDAIKAGDYERAYGHIKGYSSLGLENTPADEVGAATYAALRESYSFELYGSATVDKLTAYQQVQIRYLDLDAIHGDVETLTMANLNEIVQTRSKSQVYDENNKYLPEVTAEAYGKAVTTVLSAPKKYYVTEGVLLQLEYTDGRWMIIPSEELLRPLIGGSAY